MPPRGTSAAALESLLLCCCRSSSQAHESCFLEHQLGGTSTCHRCRTVPSTRGHPGASPGVAVSCAGPALAAGLGDELLFSLKTSSHQGVEVSQPGSAGHGRCSRG